MQHPSGRVPHPIRLPRRSPSMGLGWMGLTNGPAYSADAPSEAAPDQAVQLALDGAFAVGAQAMKVAVSHWHITQAHSFDAMAALLARSGRDPADVAHLKERADWHRTAFALIEEMTLPCR